MELRKKLKAFIDVGAVINVGVGLIVAGIIFLILAYVTPEINNQMIAANDTTWQSTWNNVASYGKTAFTFIGIGFIVGGAIYILRLVVGSLKNLF